MTDTPAPSRLTRSHPEWETVECGLALPVTREQALDWAQSARWFFESYYKFSFTFESSGYLAVPGDAEAREFRATAVTGGDAPGIYRFSVSAQGEPMTWDEIGGPGTPLLTVWDSGGTELIRIGGDD